MALCGVCVEAAADSGFLSGYSFLFYLYKNSLETDLNAYLEHVQGFAGKIKQILHLDNFVLAVFGAAAVIFNTLRFVNFFSLQHSHTLEKNRIRQ